MFLCDDYFSMAIRLFLRSHSHLMGDFSGMTTTAHFLEALSDVCLPLGTSDFNQDTSVHVHHSDMTATELERNKYSGYKKKKKKVYTPR